MIEISYSWIREHFLYPLSPPPTPPIPPPFNCPPWQTSKMELFAKIIIKITECISSISNILHWLFILKCICLRVGFMFGCTLLWNKNDTMSLFCYMVTYQQYYNYEIVMKGIHNNRPLLSLKAKINYYLNFPSRFEILIDYSLRFSEHQIHLNRALTVGWQASC